MIYSNMKWVFYIDRGTCHQSYTDFQFIVPAKVGKVMAMRHITEPAVAMEISQRATLGFLAKHLSKLIIFGLVSL